MKIFDTLRRNEQKKSRNIFWIGGILFGVHRVHVDTELLFLLSIGSKLNKILKKYKKIGHYYLLK